MCAKVKPNVSEYKEINIVTSSEEDTNTVSESSSTESDHDISDQEVSKYEQKRHVHAQKENDKDMTGTRDTKNAERTRGNGKVKDCSIESSKS